MQKDEFVKLVKLYAKFGIEICWEDLLRIPNSVVALMLHYQNRSVAKLVNMVLKTNKPLDEEYLKSAIEYVASCNVTNAVILNALKEQVIAIDKIGLIEISDELYLQEIIAGLLLDSKVRKLGIEMEVIEELLKARSVYAANVLFEYITNPLVVDKNMLFAGINFLASATIPAKIAPIKQVLLDKIGIESGLCLKYASILLDCTTYDNIDQILFDYEKAKAKYLSLKKSIRATGIRELESRIASIGGTDEITKDDIIEAIYHKNK